MNDPAPPWNPGVCHRWEPNEVSDDTTLNEMMAITGHSRPRVTLRCWFRTWGSDEVVMVEVQVISMERAVAGRARDRDAT